MDFVVITKQMPADRIEKFWGQVSVEPGGCWIWNAGKFTAGYGAYQVDGKVRYAHRIAYELINGPIPAGAHLLHSCDTPACVNPDHLTAGTHQDNIQDAISKGRWMSAKRVKHLGKLHESQVIHGMRRRDPAKRTPKPVERPSLPVGWAYASEARKGTTARRIELEGGSRMTGIFTLCADGRWRNEKPAGVVEGQVVAYRPIHP